MNTFPKLVIASISCAVTACSSGGDVGSPSDTGAFLVDSGHDSERADTVTNDAPFLDSGFPIDVVDGGDAAVSCNLAAVTAGPPCQYRVGDCSDGHTYALVCD